MSSGGQQTRKGRIGLKLLDAPVRTFVVGVVVLVLAASSLFGGLDRVTAARDRPPPATVDVPFQSAPWTVTITAARLFADLPPLHLQKEGDRWVEVIATVEVTAGESRSDLRDILRLPDVPGLLQKEPQQLYLSRDATVVDYLHPGMPELVAFFWEQSGSAPAPTQLRIVIYGKTQRIDSLSGHLSWLDHGPRAELRMPVDDRRGG